jgi:hypothetical protein
MDVPIFAIGSGASEPNAEGDYHKVIITLGFSFARIRDTSCLFLKGRCYGEEEEKAARVDFKRAP